MNVEIVSKYGSGIDTEVVRFQKERSDLLVEYEDGSEECYQHGEVVAAVHDGVNLDDSDVHDP